MKKTIIIIILSLGLHNLSSGQSKIVKDFLPICDSLSVLLHERTGVKGEVKLKAVMKRGSTLDFYFTESLGDFPWRKAQVKWFRSILNDMFPEEYYKYKLGEIQSRKVDINRLVMPELTCSGKPSDNRYKVRNTQGLRTIVTPLDGQKFTKGLSGRHIAIWQSHGRYFNQSTEKWEWQRPCLFQTCEDMFTQGFVLPYLVPMLENAGAYVMLPRERDIQKNEVIADNDASMGGRGTATYTENGKWSDAGTGFADKRSVYEDIDNPFTMGSARQALCTAPSEKPTSSVTWTPEIPEKGEYAVYVSYKTLPSSTSAAHYTVHHLGGKSEFAVNQKMGGGTWIYLGTFAFAEGTDGHVTLDNMTPKGYRMEVGAIVTADAVKFGGGMGNIARKRFTEPDDSTSIQAEAVTSGLPRSAEGARYWLQWAGADTTLYHQNDGKNDYRDDFMSRGDWVEWISRGSRVNPKSEGGLGIPVDLSFGLHTDAGVTPGDSLVGTLAIYTYRSERKTVLPAGESRLTSRMYADLVQSQICKDLQHKYDSLWTRRQIWDRGYRESRTPSAPAMLLELLSHQNFADMKFGHDPSFRFDVSRAIYKGMLKYMSNRYGCEYQVQPLPVEDMAVEFGSSRKAVISWKAVEDPLEPTASADGYILYTRMGDGTFDNGIIIDNVDTVGGRLSITVALTQGVVMSFRIAAYNQGGISFPSETVSIGLPDIDTDKSPVLIVNNFDRISGPAYIDGEAYAGFDNDSDSGVPYIRDITFVGEMNNFRREDQWISNDRPGFGASHTDMAGEIIGGNTFDYAAIHGRAILNTGYPFYSCSNERFCTDSLLRSNAWTVDLICGKQVTTTIGMQQKYTVFPSAMQSAIRDFTSKGGNMLVSGAYIGTDIWDSVYPVQIDSTFKAESEVFAKEVLGYRFISNKASRKCTVRPIGKLEGLPSAKIINEMNSETYCVESPDAIAPAEKNGSIIYRYTDSGMSAGIAHQGEGYKTICLGFPIEALDDAEDINSIIVTTLKYFEK